MSNLIAGQSSYNSPLSPSNVQQVRINTAPLSVADEMVIDSNVENNNEDNTKQAGTSTFSEPLNDLTIDVTSSEGVKIEVEDVKSGEVGTTTDSMKAEAEGDVEGDIVKTSATAAVPETAVQAPTGERREAGAKRQLELYLAGEAQRRQHIATYIEEKKLQLVAKLLSTLQI